MTAMRERILQYLRSRDYDGPRALRLVLERVLGHRGPIVGLTHIGGETIATMVDGSHVYVPQVNAETLIHDLLVVCKRCGLDGPEALGLMQEVMAEWSEHVFRPLPTLTEAEATAQLLMLDALEPGEVM